MSAVRFPADVEREDRLVWGLSARQLAELGAGAVVALVLRSITSALPLAVSAAVSFVPVAVAAALALGRHDGLAGDRLALAWLAHRRRPTLFVPAPDGVAAAPAGFAGVRVPAPLDLPVRAVGEDGVVDLGASGAALVCRASALNFGLRTQDEQHALIGIMARWLNSLSTPVQIVVHTEPVDMGHLVAEIETGAGGLPHRLVGTFVQPGREEFDDPVADVDGDPADRVTHRRVRLRVRSGRCFPGRGTSRHP